MSSRALSTKLNWACGVLDKIVTAADVYQAVSEDIIDIDRLEAWAKPNASKHNTAQAATADPRFMGLLASASMLCLLPVPVASRTADISFLQPCVLLLSAYTTLMPAMAQKDGGSVAAQQEMAQHLAAAAKCSDLSINSAPCCTAQLLGQHMSSSCAASAPYTVIGTKNIMLIMRQWPEVAHYQL